jgi:hypothetical protein
MDDLGFTYKARKNGEVEILHRGRRATTLRDATARDFLSAAATGGEGDLQQAMARLTGNFKRGNERTAAEHPRNRNRGKGTR